jgi:hypothetical protein
MVKGVQRELPLVGDWGYPPAIILPPLLEEGEWMQLILWIIFA